MIPDVFALNVYAAQLSELLSGGIAQKLRLVHPEIYRLKIYVPGKGNLMLYFDITGKLYVGKSLGEQYSAENRFTQLVNKYLRNKRLERIDLVNFDRILAFKFSDGYSLIFEWMRRGNLILLDSENKIIAAAKEAKLRDREILPGKVYQAPPKPSEIPGKYQRLGLAKQLLLELARPDRSYIYISQDGRIVDVLPFKLEDLHPGAQIQELTQSILETLNELYMQEIYGKLASHQQRLQNKDLAKKAKTLEHLRRNLEQLKKRLEEIQKAIEFLETNYDKLEELRTIIERIVSEKGEQEANDYLRKLSKGKARLVREKEDLYIEIERS
jgi:predicted ribosome quality control (RQC) complex YloA/Tae2 family protein